MAQMIFSKTYSAGQKIFAMGDEGRNAYFIERGRVQVSLPKDDGETITYPITEGARNMVISQVENPETPYFFRMPKTPEGTALAILVSDVKEVEIAPRPE